MTAKYFEASQTLDDFEENDNKFEDLVNELTKLESLPLPKPSIEDLKVMNDHLKMAANKMEKTPGSAMATSKWKPNGFDPRMNSQEFRPTFGRPKIDKKKMKNSPCLESLPLPKPSIEDLKVINDHLKMAANNMEKTPGSAVATSKWKPMVLTRG